MGNDGKNFVISLAAGLFAAFLLYSYSQEKKSEYDKKYGDMVTVFVAKEDIAEMQTIYDNVIEAVERPRDYIEPDVATAESEIVGNVAAVPIRKGQQIVKNKLYQPGPDTGISLQVALSKRAVTMPVDDVRGVAKLVRPGDRVDILAAIDTGKGVDQKRDVITLMQDVTVLATGVSIVNNMPRVVELDASGNNLTQTALTGDTKYNTITIEASPKEAQDLVYMLSTAPGNLFFILRNPNDRAIPPRLPSSNADSVAGKPSVGSVSPTMPAGAGPSRGN